MKQENVYELHMMSARQHHAKVLEDIALLRCNSDFFNFKGHVCMTSKSHFIPNFELRSITLLAALTVGTAMCAHAQTPDAAGAKPATPPTQGAPAAKAAPAQNTETIFARADANKDGKLSKQEAARFPAIEQRFEEIDTNKDQFVSREEFEAALKS
ncbi:MAG: EF-hand domain-containing protein [Pseudomonadota bacterium]|nr:EF-hand domain-containing protein [Pseudomonadota bacterium]